jgi:endonuclease YncB( thermonuclease family)
MRVLLLLLWFAIPMALGETLAGRVVAVADGDTLTIVDAAKGQHRIRLAEIDAPERKQAFGTQSRQSLAELCLKKEAKVETQGAESNKRYIGRVSCEGVDASAEQVRRGMAWVSAKQTGPASPLYELEAHARLRQIGLWADPEPVAPWEWRAAQRPK